MKHLLYVIPLVLTLRLSSTFPVLATERSDQSELPPELRLPDAYKRGLESVGRGVQIYDCADEAWTLREPAATLFDKRSEDVVAIHYVGPTWQSIGDGSKVDGAAKARHDAPNPQRDIPWLLLEATSTTGPGLFAEVQFIQRLDTMGGVAPAGPCTAGQTASVPYQALYVFWATAS
jgi:hypothetical protein